MASYASVLSSSSRRRAAGVAVPSVVLLCPSRATSGVADVDGSISQAKTHRLVTTDERFLVTIIRRSSVDHMDVLWTLLDDDAFWTTAWERTPVARHRHDGPAADTGAMIDPARQIFSLSVLRALLQTNRDLCGKVNVCKVEADGRRINYTPDSASAPPSAQQLWQLFEQQGCTLQVFQPQQHWPLLAEQCSKLEERIGCLVGTNAYLTPPSSQGLAPHHDDVEVFVIQLEGTKTWCLHEPTMTLPRDHSGDLPRATLGRKIMEVTLRPGSLLYMPRGTVHYARTHSEDLSHHLTISTYQHNSWFDLLSAAVPRALANAFEKDERYRHGLPLNMFDFMGTRMQAVPAQQMLPQVDANRRIFAATAKNLLLDLVNHINLDEAADEHSMDFFASRLPPFPRRVPTLVPIEDNHQKSPDEIKIRWRFPNHVRLLIKPDIDIVLLFFSVGNETALHMNTPDPTSATAMAPFVQLPKTCAPALATLCATHPAALGLSSLPGLTLELFNLLVHELGRVGLLEVFAPKHIQI